jgi:hypothetical protein
MKPVNIVDLIDSLKQFLTYSTVEKISQDEALEHEVNITSEQKSKLPGLIKALDNDFMPIYGDVMQNQQIAQVENFGKNLVALGDANSLEIIARYGKELCYHAESFDIEKIMGLLKQFPKLIEKCKALMEG